MVTSKRPTDTPPRAALGALAVGAALISSAPILVKASGAALGPTAIGLWRCLFGSAVLMTMALAVERRPPDRALLRYAFVAGGVFTLDLFWWHRSILLAGAGMATILGNTQVFGTALLSVVVFRERVSARFLIAATIAIAGVVLLVGVGSEVSFTSRYLAGIAYGLLTGLVYAVYLVLLRSAGRGAGSRAPLTLLAWTSVFASAGLALAGLAEGSRLEPPDLRTWLFLALLGLVPQSLGWWTIYRSLPKVPGAAAGLILLLQPVLATVWGAILFAETLTPLQMLGAGVTLVCIYVGSVRR